jgi:hypothetical protein
LDPESLPTPEAKDPTDWTPFSSHIEFETAEFIYRTSQMSAGKFGTLCNLWAATLMPHDAIPPFSNYRELCKTIDATPVGGVAWQNIDLSYQGQLPEEAPMWMEDQYTLWYRDPRLVFKNMLENPEFQELFDYAPFRQYDANGDRRYENVMSGDWAWNQAVSESNHGSGVIVAHIVYRISLHAIPIRMVRCSSLLF